MTPEVNIPAVIKIQNTSETMHFKDLQDNTVNKENIISESEGFLTINEGQSEQVHETQATSHNQNVSIYCSLVIELFLHYWQYHEMLY